MNKANAYAAVRAGLDGVAVVSAICSQKNPKTAAAAIKAEVVRAKGGVVLQAAGSSQNSTGCKQ
jgi:hypothetical protein